MFVVFFFWAIHLASNNIQFGVIARKKGKNIDQSDSSWHPLGFKMYSHH